jgi:hypothetical protein
LQTIGLLVINHLNVRAFLRICNEISSDKGEFIITIQKNSISPEPNPPRHPHNCQCRGSTGLHDYPSPLSRSPSQHLIRRNFPKQKRSPVSQALIVKSGFDQRVRILQYPRNHLSRENKAVVAMYGATGVGAKPWAFQNKNHLG